MNFTLSAISSCSVHDKPQVKWLHVIECVARIPESVLPVCVKPAPEGDRERESGRLCQPEPEPATGIARTVIEIRPFDPDICRDGSISYTPPPDPVTDPTSGTGTGARPPPPPPARYSI